MKLSPFDLDRLEASAIISTTTLHSKVLLSLVAMARQAPRWTRVEEGMPPMQTAVYVLSPRVSGPFTATWNGEQWSSCENDLIEPGFLVTLWAPLPEPPK